MSAIRPLHQASRLLRVDLAARAALALHTAIESTLTPAPFAALADSLANDLLPLFDREAPIPAQKARLTRIGGRCPSHGTLLEFDPFQPHRHACTRCAQVYTAQEHDDWWAMNAQLWTAERAVHAAALHAVRHDDRHAAVAISILRRYTARYDSWPNADNVLGPSRPFFSTYLESIWLLNLCHAVSLLEATSKHWTPADASQFRDRVLEPSAELIDGFHEGQSNRQVWNEVAVCSAWTLLDREEEARTRLASSRGISGLVASGLDVDGFWYEGENYHVFAHRGLWYGVELMRALGVALPERLDARYAAGFVAPLLGLLPDETFPSRRDAQYGSSIRQWRTAEWGELGWAHSHDPRIASMLASLYESPTPRRDTGRSRSTADAERNTAPTALTRADLSWRALLMADAEVPSAVQVPAASVCLESQGLAILRRDEGRTYVALEGGKSGGGHGHPDQLALTLQTGAARWLEDPGTGSYVEPRLAWYRSSLAHHAPLFDGRKQSEAEATLEAFEDRRPWGWMMKRVESIAPGVSAERTVLAADGYLIDVLEWESAHRSEMTLPIATVASVDVVDEDALDAGELGLNSAPSGSSAPSDLDPGFAFTREQRLLATGRHFALIVSPSATADHLHAVADQTARVWYATSQAATLYRAVVPAAPGLGETQRHWLTTCSTNGRVVGVWNWRGAEGRAAAGIASVMISAAERCEVSVTLESGIQHHHQYGKHAWCIDVVDATTQPTVILERVRSDARKEGDDPPPLRVSAGNAARRALQVPAVPDSAIPAAPGAPIVGAHRIELGEPHYVPTERPWREAGRPSALLQLTSTSKALIVDVDVRTGPPVAASREMPNPLDNELNDVNADGVQWYFGLASPAPRQTGEWFASGLVVPFANAQGELMARPTRLSGTELDPSVSVRRTREGWAMRLTWSLMDLPSGGLGDATFELVVNERPPERERRRGQLVLSGGGGFGYLAGSRRPVDRALQLLPGHHAEDRA